MGGSSNQCAPVLTRLCDQPLTSLSECKARSALSYAKMSDTPPLCVSVARGTGVSTQRDASLAFRIYSSAWRVALTSLSTVYLLVAPHRTHALKSI